MRENIFRAKRIDDGEWVEGYLLKYSLICEEKTYILPLYSVCVSDVEVDPETVCQYTGLTDKNGRKIFEGDILEIETKNLSKEDGYFTVKWSEPGSCFVLCGKRYFAHFDNVYKNRREVISNIFDNPKLIGEQP